VRWIRLLLKSLAAEGRTVFVSSHLMNEMAQTATRLVVLGRGRLISETSVEDFTSPAAAGVLVRTLSGITAEQIGTAAWRAHLPVYELTLTHASLEEAFMQVTRDSIEYHAGAAPSGATR
jgi:ABC-2 type transport system ATP-binding protein